MAFEGTVEIASVTHPQALEGGVCVAWERPSRGWRARPSPHVLPRCRCPLCSWAPALPATLLPTLSLLSPDGNLTMAQVRGCRRPPGGLCDPAPRSLFSFVLSFLTCFPVFPFFDFFSQVSIFPPFSASRGLHPSPSQWTGISLDMNKGPCLRRRTEGVHRHRLSYLLFKTVLLGCKRSSRVVGQISPE